LVFEHDELIAVGAVLAPGVGVTFGDKARIDGLALRVEDVAEQPAVAIAVARVRQEQDSSVDERIVAGGGVVGGYNLIWINPGDRVVEVDGQKRTSLVVDPPDGRIPPLTPDAQKRRADAAERMRDAAKFTRRVRERVGVPVIGVGGIRTAADAREYLAAGATLVAIGTAALADPRVPQRVARELSRG